MPNCKQCSTGFEVTDGDRQFYEKMGVPEPTLCYPCRVQRQMLWGNQVNLYKRKCDATGDSIVTAYHPECPLKVYKQSYWWDTAKFDVTEFGRDFDFNRPFFEQWAELAKAVPRPALHTMYQFDENSDYTNYAGYNKDSYMIFDSDYNWGCLYSMSANKSKNCVDCNRIKESELCYECVDCTKCYSLYYSQDCDNCSHSAFLKNCIGVKNSFMCSNLKNKEYYVFNKPYDKAIYEKLMKSLSDPAALVEYFKDWADFKVKFPQKYMHGVQNEGVSGDYLVYSKNAENCFDSMQLWDCKNFVRAFGETRDSMDCYECGDKVERFYESAFSGYNSQNVRFSMFCFNEQHDLDYCFYLNFCHDCFGCVGLNRKKFCILNKEYPEAEYRALKSKIIEHMKKAGPALSKAGQGEWGEFFPAKYSDFAYNESIAFEYFPLSRDEALARGLKWREKDKADYQPATKELLACEVCGRNYKIIPQELKFYKDQGIALPKQCFFCRHKARFALRNRRTLYDRKCAECKTAIRTTYAPDSPWIVACESCYQASLV